MSLISEIKKIETQLTGLKASEEDINQLVEQLPDGLVPSYLLSLLKSFPLAGVCFSLDEENDESEFGADLKWLTVRQMLEEALEVYPGKVVLKLGYLPIASCLAGSGDPYFLKVLNDNDDPPLVRIPHEFASDDGEYPESEIEVVCRSLSQFFNRAEID
ncbi:MULTISPECIES: hypothetical protein [Vibrio harveyi group]|uniref:hypothetical protein n=1 Tax=Vibrio harveyi group TaxID=717610 RepID=UPI00215F1131|nr:MULTISPECIES: hypothetical protein [Vibrio harveyi group]MCR9365224.1 hypothetical protein [Vibrio antiquarius]MCS0160652.1 hypothetical protein [Vibrio alginolyticus]MCS0211207.1 hypothetical protein [Vibrio alginolyticus]